MGSERIVIDISSDEEVSYADNWTNASNEDVGGDMNECENVMRADQFSSSNMTCHRDSAVRNMKEDDLQIDSDDDCVILKVKPDDKVPHTDDASKGDDDDDILIVQEKGELACRDYPHPRHLCAKFCFSTTPHPKYCDMCHCYVCDSPAPCIYWNSGPSGANHCHATDKDKRWNAERKFFKVLNRRLLEPKQVEIGSSNVFTGIPESESYQDYISALPITTLLAPPPENPPKTFYVPSRTEKFYVEIPLELPKLKRPLHIPGMKNINRRKLGGAATSLEKHPRCKKLCPHGASST